MWVSKPVYMCEKIVTDTYVYVKTNNPDEVVRIITKVLGNIHITELDICENMVKVRISCETFKTIVTIFKVLSVIFEKQKNGCIEGLDCKNCTGSICEEKTK